jgi:hypothetical protein
MPLDSEWAIIKAVVKTKRRRFRAAPTATLLNLPPELMLDIADYTEVLKVAALSQTCRSLHMIL